MITNTILDLTSDGVDDIEYATIPRLTGVFIYFDTIPDTIAPQNVADHYAFLGWFALGTGFSPFEFGANEWLPAHVLHWKDNQFAFARIESPAQDLVFRERPDVTKIRWYLAPGTVARIILTEG